MTRLPQDQENSEDLPASNDRGAAEVPESDAHGVKGNGASSPAEDSDASAHDSSTSETVDEQHASTTSVTASSHGDEDNQEQAASSVDAASESDAEESVREETSNASADNSAESNDEDSGGEASPATSSASADASSEAAAAGGGEDAAEVSDASSDSSSEHMSETSEDEEKSDSERLSDTSVHDRVTKVADTPAPAAEPPEGIRVRYAGCTAVGLVREHNEDNFVMANLANEGPSPRNRLCEDIVGEHGLLFAVCDGMGGAAAGEVASQMAVDSLLETLREGGVPRERDDLARRLVSSVEHAGHRIYTVAQNERAKRGMGTTATVAVLLDKILFLAEVGDSRAYLLRRGVLRQLTKDQSLVNQLIEAGHLTEEEAEAFEHSNIILQALGTSETVQVDLTFAELRRGDRLMLCSDGLSGMVHNDSIREALIHFHDPVQCAERLVEYAEAGGGHDNITVVVADFDGADLALPSEADTFGYMQYPLVPAGSTTTGRPPKGHHKDSDDEHSEPVSTIPSPPLAETGSWSWIAAGVSALLVGGVVLALSTQNDPDALVEEPPPAAEQASPETEPVDDPAPEPEPVKKVAVRVYTDVEQATLLVNGEPHGQLPADRELALELEPGAYRFEAESNGNITAVSVVTVRPDVPLDVHLNLPGEQAPAEESPEAPAAPSPPESDVTPEPAASAPAAPAEKKPTPRKPAAPKAEPAPVPEAPVQANPTPATEPTVPAPKEDAPTTAPQPTPAPTAPAPKEDAPTTAPQPTPAPTAPAPAPEKPATPSDLPANPF